MNILELIQAVKDRDWKVLLRMAGELLIQMSGGPVVMTTAPPTAEQLTDLDAALAEAKGDTAVKVGASPVPTEFDPIAAISLVMAAIELWKKWRKK